MLKIIKRMFNYRNSNGDSDKDKDKYKNSKKNMQLSNSYRVSKISPSLDDNLKSFQSTFKDSPHIIYRRFKIGSKNGLSAAIIFIDGLVDKLLLDEQVLKPLMYLTRLNGDRYSNDITAGLITDLNISLGEVKDENNREELVKAILSGMTVLLLDNSDKALILSAPGWEKRAVEEPDNEKVIRGPKEGFVESLKVNVSLVQRRIQDTDLKMKNYELGRRSKTKVSLLYMDGIIKRELLDEIDSRISTIDIDMIYDTATIEAFIEDSPYSPFPQALPTERPDRVAANLMEGRAAILVDGSPFGLVIPVTLATLYQSPEDYYERFIYGTAVRFLRLVSFIISTSLPALYISMLSFHNEMLPTRLVLTLAMGRVQVPYPAFFEALLMELTIELLREASTRLPGPLGQTIGIIGALVLGQAAVAAELVSPAMIIVVALTAMATFVVPLYSLSYPIRLIRFPFMLLAAYFGAFGIFVGWTALLIHLCTLESFGIPYMSPFAPLKISDWKDTIVRLPIWTMKKRSKTPETVDKTRLGSRKGDHARD